jgi:DNA-binding HxlR family transcriptional regulator
MAQRAQDGTFTRPRHIQGTDCETEGSHVRDVLDTVGDKWSVYVITVLDAGTMRFTELKRAIDGISQRMLTVTLRGLERDGIVARTVYPIIPPRVDYELTPMGRTLLDTICQLLTWTCNHLEEIDAARAAYDRRQAEEHAINHASPSNGQVVTAEGQKRGDS